MNECSSLTLAKPHDVLQCLRSSQAQQIKREAVNYNQLYCDTSPKFMSAAIPAEATSVRLDKWLWAVRLFKTRSQAADACRLLRVRMSGQEVKAARLVKIGDEYEIHLEDIIRTVRVKSLLAKRVAGKLVAEYLDDLTLPSLIEAAKAKREARAMSPVIAPVFKPNRRERELLAKLYTSSTDAPEA